MVKTKSGVLTEEEKRILKKKKSALKLTPKEREVLEKRRKEMEAKLEEDIRVGKKVLLESEAKAEEAIREHPLQYVFGAFVAGVIIGKLLK